MEKTVLMSVLLNAVFLFVSVEPSFAQQGPAARCMRLVPSALSVELLESEVQDLARLSMNPRILDLLRVGARRAGAQAYYSGIVIGAVGYCSIQGISINYNSIYQAISNSAGNTDAEKMKPPGDCTPSEHRRLQDIVNAACSSALRCASGISREEINARIAAHMRCIEARTTINQRCFRGGDLGHNTEIDGRKNAIENCIRVRDNLRE